MWSDLNTNFHKYRKYIFRVFLPVIIVVLLFLFSMFLLIIPAAKNAIFEQKKSHVKELTETAWGILYAYFYDEIEGLISSEDAKKLAISSISRLRYGKDNKEYFWIIDTVPNMVMHPYREDLIGKNLQNFKDKKGKKLFVDAVKAVDSTGDAYITYMWQYHNDSSRVLQKTSYVKIFKPWGWIVGTGIYLFDVKYEMKRITNRMIEIAVIIIIVIIVIMIFVLRQSLAIELNRQQTEKELRKAKDQYQALAEATPEGTIIVFDDNSVNLNKNMLMILGYREDEVGKLSIYDIILQHQVNAYLGEKYFRYLILGVAKPKQFETKLKRKNGSFIDMFVTCSRIQLPDKMAIIISVKDIAIENIVRKQLNIQKEKYRELFDIVHLGIIRTTYNSNEALILDTNHAFVEILHYINENELIDCNFFNLFQQNDDLVMFKQYLTLSGYVRNLQIKLLTKDKLVVEVILSAVLISSSENNSSFLDVLIHDRSNEIKKLHERDKMLVELQTSYLYLNTPLENIYSKLVYCKHDDTVEQLIEIMIKEGKDAILVKENNEFKGIITDHDLRDRVLFKGLQNDCLAKDFMTQPLISLHETSTIYEAMLIMQQNKINHISIRNSKMEIIGMISVNDIMHIQQSTSSNLIMFIKNSNSNENWSSIFERVQTHVKNLLMSGANISSIHHFITSICDVLTEKLCQWAIEKYGQAPANFCFIALGSQGRGELSLKTDQDNAILFDDSGSGNLNELRSYFIKFAEDICYGLDSAGFELCQGDLMAMNAKWCLSLSEWKSQFYNWINFDSKDESFEFTAFFDMRVVFGDNSLLLQLKNYVIKELKNNQRFVELLAANVKEFKPPVNLFGKFITEKTSKHPEAINIKKPVQAVSDLIRMLSIKHGILDTNTLERIEQLIIVDTKNHSTYDELVQAFNYLGLLRIKNQLDQLNKEQIPDNYLNPKLLSEIDTSTLKQVFTEIVGSFNKFE